MNNFEILKRNIQIEDIFEINNLFLRDVNIISSNLFSLIFICKKDLINIFRRYFYIIFFQEYFGIFIILISILI